MPRDANGNTQPLAGTIVSTGDTILPSQHNPALVDIYAMMTQSLSRDGQGGMRTNLDMSSFRIINVSNGVNPNDAVNFSQISVLSPLGVPLPFAGVNVPSGYILCAGQEISRTGYAALFSVLGTAWGSGNGTTTFNVPDFRGRILAGADNMGGSFAGRLTAASGWAFGAVFTAVAGAETQTLTVSQMPPHNHAGSTTDLQGLHTHNTTMWSRGDAGSPQPGTWAQGGNVSVGNQNVDASGIHGHNLNITVEGSGAAHPNVQPTAIINYILRTGI